MIASHNLYKEQSEQNGTFKIVLKEAENLKWFLFFSPAEPDLLRKILSGPCIVFQRISSNSSVTRQECALPRNIQVFSARLWAWVHV